MVNIFFNNLKSFLKYLIILIILTSNVNSAEDTLSISSPNYFLENTNIYNDIHYLKNEFLSFNFCSQSSPINVEVNLVCSNGDTTKLDLFNSKSKGCQFSNYDLDLVKCDDFSLEINYDVDNKAKKIKRTFVKQKQSLLINHILNQDYTLLSPIDLSYYMVILNELEQITSKNNADAYNKLKNDRNNAEKCWPTSACNIEETAKILQNLKLAGYSLDSRLLKDGQNYLEKNQISNSKNPLKFDINLTNTYINNSKVSCTLNIDSEVPKTYIFDSSTTSLEKYASNTIGFSCNESVENIDLTLYSLGNTVSKVLSYPNLASFSHTINSFSCIGNSGICNYDATINSLLTYSSNILNANLLENYVDNLIVDVGDTISFNTNNEIRDTGKYLFYKDNLKLLDNLKFKQNNDGSWGTGTNANMLEKTSWSVRGLNSKDPSTEYVKDGKKWIYYNEPITGWSSTKDNAIAYLAIKESLKPYLKINSKNELVNNTLFTLKNPTIYNLKDLQLTFDENINNYLSYTQNLGDLDSENEVSFKVNLNDNFFGKQSGQLTITGVTGKNEKLELISMPILLRGPMPFDLISNDNYSVSEDNFEINLDIKKNLDSFNISCSYKNPFDFGENTVLVSDLTKKITIVDKLLLDGNFSLDLKCNQNKDAFSFPINFNVNVATKNFDIVENSALITSPINDFSIHVTNTLKTRQVLSFEVLGDLNGIIVPAEKSKVIAANDTREIFFVIEDKTYLKGLNLTSTNILIKSSLGYTKKIPIELNINSTVVNSSIPIWAYVLGGFILFLISFIVIGRYLRQREDNTEMASNDEEYFDEDMEFK